MRQSNSSIFSLTFGIFAQHRNVSVRFEGALLWLTWLALKGLGAGSRSSVDYVLPISVGAGGQLLPSFHEQHARVAYFTRALFDSAKALLKFGLILFAVCEARR